MVRRWLGRYGVLAVCVLGAWLLRWTVDHWPPPPQAHAWLHDRTCPLPCWAGVIPGTTTVTDALHLWASSPLIAPGSVVTYTWSAGGSPAASGAIQWHWPGTDHGGTATYRLMAVPQRVQDIRLDLRGLPPGPLRLGAVVDTLGPPEEVEAWGGYGIDTGPAYGVGVVYSRYGLALQQDAAGSKPTFDRDLPLTQVQFAAPPGTTSREPRQPWTGWHDFDYYCHNSRAPSRPCPPEPWAPRIIIGLDLLYGGGLIWRTVRPTRRPAAGPRTLGWGILGLILGALTLSLLGYPPF